MRIQRLLVQYQVMVRLGFRCHWTTVHQRQIHRLPRPVIRAVMLKMGQQPPLLSVNMNRFQANTSHNPVAVVHNLSSSRNTSIIIHTISIIAHIQRINRQMINHRWSFYSQVERQVKLAHRMRPLDSVLTLQCYQVLVIMRQASTHSHTPTRTHTHKPISIDQLIVQQTKQQ